MSEISESDTSLRLVRREYDPGSGPTSHQNDPSTYALVLPYSRGDIRAEREGTVIHDGPTGPGMVRVLVPGERSALLVRSGFESAVALIPRATLEDMWGGRPQAPLHAARREVARLVPTFASALELRGRRRDLVVEGLTSALVGLMLGRQARGRRGSGLTDEEFALASAFAEDRIDVGLRLEDWSAHLEMDSAAFSRAFNEYVGSPPYAWFLDRRIAEARRLLTETEMSIREIASATGFSSQSHLNDAFRDRTGVSPGRWRRRSEA